MTHAETDPVRLAAARIAEAVRTADWPLDLDRLLDQDDDALGGCDDCRRAALAAAIDQIHYLMWSGSNPRARDVRAADQARGDAIAAALNRRTGILIPSRQAVD